MVLRREHPARYTDDNRPLSKTYGLGDLGPVFWIITEAPVGTRRCMFTDGNARANCSRVSDHDGSPWDAIQVEYTTR